MAVLWESILLPLCVAELFLSIVIHVLFAASFLCSAVAKIVYGSLFRRPVVATNRSEVRQLEVDSAAIAAAERHFDSRSGYGEGHSQGQPHCPIVLVHGIFGFGEGKLGGLSYWGGAEKMDSSIIVADLGSLTSIHDRACELFYFLKGGTVDYGAEHSEKYCHSQYGRTYAKGQHPNWDEDHPVHFVGHSVGVQVIRLLQQMLADKKFEGHENTSADWVLSVTCVSGALNGTTRAYIDGMRPGDGLCIKSISILQFLRVATLVCEWLDISILKRNYSFGFEHFNLSFRKSGLSGLARAMRGQTGPFATGDWILPDLCIQQAIRLNRSLETHCNTYYWSYATQGTGRFLGLTIPSSILEIHPVLLIRSWQMARWRPPSQEKPPYPGFKHEEWRDNDGALNTISMLYPRLPDAHPHCYVGKKFVDGQTMNPGIWYYCIVKGDHMTFILNRERAGFQFDALYDGIFQRCRKHFRKCP